MQFPNFKVWNNPRWVDISLKSINQHCLFWIPIHYACVHRGGIMFISMENGTNKQSSSSSWCFIDSCSWERHESTSPSYIAKCFDKRFYHCHITIVEKEFNHIKNSFILLILCNPLQFVWFHLKRWSLPCTSETIMDNSWMASKGYSKIMNQLSYHIFIKHVFF